ncbi:unnamed protein product [Ranitomeya imitator]|uniref:TIR domain-containing protein n=1 Tax=Ranitomeya imitator TaxID=111125 RepID=A0ABN9M4D3_9NEOB|nr:unnamed protein product [Ranitomeya imitator]
MKKKHPQINQNLKDLMKTLILSTPQYQVVTKSPYSCDWIKDALKSEIFNEYKSDEKIEIFKIDGDRKFRKSVSSCSCVVFCFESDQWDSESSREVEELSFYYGLKNVIILLSEKTPDNCPPRQVNGQHKFPVLNFSKQQIAWYKDNLKLYNTKIEKMKTILKGLASWTQGHKVGIFSRSSESEYEWLKMELESEYFRGSVENVQSYYISNRGFQQFMTNVSNCTFGILYHTKNRGRINITDVTDSLYDDELDYMSSMMNKNVIVVVDDLNDGNEEEKSRILSSQHSIKEKALDLFLFTTEEKKLLEPLVKMRNTINGACYIGFSCLLEALRRRGSTSVPLVVPVDCSEAIAMHRNQLMTTLISVACYRCYQ